MTMTWGQARERLEELKRTIKPVDGFSADYWSLQNRILDSIYHDQIYQPNIQPKGK